MICVLKDLQSGGRDSDLWRNKSFAGNVSKALLESRGGESSPGEGNWKDFRQKEVFELILRE